MVATTSPKPTRRKGIRPTATRSTTTAKVSERSKQLWSGRMLAENLLTQLLTMKRIKMMKRLTKNQQAKAQWNMNEGERIYNLMEDAMLLADKSISGTVAMNYALSKLIANYKLAMRDLDIEVDDYISTMVDFWEYQLEHDQAYDRCLFDAYTEEVKEKYFRELLAN
jgi:hypothetical protein